MLKSTYLRNEKVICRKIVEETLLVPIQGDLANMRRIFSLNPAGEYIWLHLDGEKSLEDILEGMLDAFDVTRQRALKDIFRFREELVQEKLIVEVSQNGLSANHLVE